MRRRLRAFTIVELLVVVAIISVLVGILLPAVGRARQKAKAAQSESNLRSLSAAHANYASEWNDRQFTLTVDTISNYGDNAVAAVEAYHSEKDKYPPPIELGWAAHPGSPNQGLRMLKIQPAFPRNYALLEPIAFQGAWGDENDIERFGYFRLPNARQFTQYLNGNFYDPVFYAPKDEIVQDMLAPTQDAPSEYIPLLVMQQNYGWSNTDFCYSSYSLSPAALFHPEVLNRDDPDDPLANGWQDPWLLPAGFRAPAMSQARYPSLKTHMLEHHWLQNAKSGCNPAVPEGRLRPYKDCQPYFFNSAWDSTPVTLFFDGHIQLIGVRATQQADSLVRAQGGDGLWRRDTPFGDNGYWGEWAFDDAATSFHILTTDGIKGRDVVSGR